MGNQVKGVSKPGNKLLRYFWKGMLVLIMFLIAFSGYVYIKTANTKEMTIRQRILKSVYPAYTWFGRLVGWNSKAFSNDSLQKPPTSFYDIQMVLNNGDTISLSAFRGKKVLIVNTASDCGYTDQYDELQELFESNKEQLVVIGFPANDFKEQEKKSDDEIAEFCRMNYGVTFPLARKSSVVPGNDQNHVFQWLTDKNRNGWTNKKPSWNFSKYLVNEEGILTHYFDPSVSPLGKQVKDAINKK